VGVDKEERVLGVDKIQVIGFSKKLTNESMDFPKPWLSSLFSSKPLKPSESHKSFSFF